MMTTQTQKPGTQAGDASRQTLYQTNKQQGNDYASFTQLPPEDLHSLRYGEKVSGL